MSVTVKKQKWTYGDYLQIDDNNRYEIYKGELIMVPAPSSWHQRYSRNIEFLMWSYVKEKGLGEVLYAPLDVIFTEDNVYQPDIVFVSKENMPTIHSIILLLLPQKCFKRSTSTFCFKVSLGSLPRFSPDSTFIEETAFSTSGSRS